MDNPFLLLLYFITYCFSIPVLIISTIYKKYRNYRVKMFRKETFKLVQGEKVEKNLHNWY